MTTRCAFKIEDPSLGPGRVDFRAPDEGFGLEGSPKPKIQRDPSPKKDTFYWLVLWEGCLARSPVRPSPGPAGNVRKS